MKPISKEQFEKNYGKRVNCRFSGQAATILPLDLGGVYLKYRHTNQSFEFPKITKKQLANLLDILGVESNT